MKRTPCRFMMRGAVGVVSIGVLFFLSAGRLRWKEGWLQIGARLLAHCATATVVAPDLLAERSTRHHANQKGWDPLIFACYGLTTARLMPVLAGLDARFGWKPRLGSGLKSVSFGFFVLGNALCIWAMKVNAFFSSVVRIQDDRGQAVISSGPYRWVRHPGYVGFIIQTIAGPLMLGSVWATLLGIVAALMLILRTALEDRVLRQELAGYDHYAEQVRWRLVPGIW